jgi:hypothetical protein
VYIIFESVSKQWVKESKVDGFSVWLLTSNREEAFAFASEVQASSVVGMYYGNPAFKCRIERVT